MGVLITGSSGFLGKQLLKKIKNSVGYDLIDNYDILNIDMIEKMVFNNKIETIIHLAAVSDLNKFSDDESFGNKINIEGSRNIIKVCRKHNLRLLFASTCCCYGNNDCHPSDEESPICPTEPYAISKKIIEDDLAKEHFPYTIMRLATFYGPEMRKELANYIFMDKIYKGEKIKIHGNGKQTRTYTHVDDIIGCIIQIYEQPHTYNIVNCTSTESISVLDVIKICENITGKKSDIEFVEDRKGQIIKEMIINDRIKNLGYSFKYKNFKEGMNNLFLWYIKNEQ